jgi:heme o synthase
VRLLSIAKPGMIFGNLVTVSGGFFLGSQTHFNILTYLSTLVGMALIIGAGCMLNNVFDSDIDRLMERTKNRPLAKDLLPGKLVVLCGIICAMAGCVLLHYTTNTLTVIVALIGLFFYVGVYTMCLKRKSVYGTIIGGISGAVPPMAGYVAATGRFDIGALILFCILFFWQLPHFYAISIYRLEDFRAANIPVLPLRTTIAYTKINILVYTIAFTVAAVMPSIVGYTGWVYGIVAGALGIAWLVMGIKGFNHPDEKKWARKMFLFSILIITVISLLMAVKI